MSKGAASVEVTPVAALYPAPPVVDGFVVESNAQQQATMQASTDEAIARVIQADEDEATRRAVEAACVAQRQAISATWVSPVAPVHAVSQGGAGATCGCGACHCRQCDAAAWACCGCTAFAIGMGLWGLGCCSPGGAIYGLFHGMGGEASHAALALRLPSSPVGIYCPPMAPIALKRPNSQAAAALPKLLRRVRQARYHDNGQRCSGAKQAHR
mmetsp:Transcript_23556/g.79556  ORF Transcript_23556/g.79556 Transcript_23556/m.79556 type:complete len:213 (+) Transcript_23556:231-869(+)